MTASAIVPRDCAIPMITSKGKKIRGGGSGAGPGEPICAPKGRTDFSLTSAGFNSHALIPTTACLTHPVLEVIAGVGAHCFAP